MKRALALVLCGLLGAPCWGQAVNAAEPLPDLNHWQITHTDIAPWLSHFAKDPRVKVAQIGESFEGRSISALQLGSGPTRVMMWTQMHGDEPTATAAVMDLLAQLLAPEHAERWAEISEKISLRIIPMLNPDGAEEFRRHNAQSIDINRDARALQTPEGRLLMAQAKMFKPHIGFNLHDQDRRLGVAGRPATISVLAPAFDEAKSASPSRDKAMQLIATMLQALPENLQQQVGRYDDTYAVRAFGDTFSAMNIATVLIESGGNYQDPNRQTARAANVLMLQAALDAIVDGSYQSVPVARYWAIPENEDNALFDVLLRDVQVAGKHAYRVDIGVQQSIYNPGAGFVGEVGDLKPFGGYQVIDASGLTYAASKPYPLKAGTTLTLTDARYLRLLAEGYSHFLGEAEQLEIATSLPVLRLSSAPEYVTARPARRTPAFFLLTREGRNAAAVLGGQWVPLDGAEPKVSHAKP
ncbi:hypothetical protein L1F30_11555 [Simiduia sp. 21SJ11W-1]|uniref:M14 family zinc carboxypeptidase n=1 Tax=Simiduia sp. 21SJ11W-1 TaxID=2909669 RepID=UPI0020A1F461|nr:M14 family zinc carboxypeptidase [Simiduia sp. 21SJ11W-1]UTA46795.1 hypothetical protein L1F30_11555 [Simiduia sp. 21SJ11W-1]